VAVCSFCYLDFPSVVFPSQPPPSLSLSLSPSHSTSGRLQHDLYPDLDSLDVTLPRATAAAIVAAALAEDEAPLDAAYRRMVRASDASDREAREVGPVVAAAAVAVPAIARAVWDADKGLCLSLVRCEESGGRVGTGLMRRAAPAVGVAGRMRYQAVRGPVLVRVPDLLYRYLFTHALSVS
jgi:hypothetical protein